MTIERWPNLIFATIWFIGQMSGCELSVRDQALLIQLIGTAPPVGLPHAIEIAGGEVDCAVLGSFTVVRYGSSGMYVLDPVRAFERWGQTGLSPSGGDSLALRFYFGVYRNSELYGLWRNYGRPKFSREEVSWMQPNAVTSLSWQKFKLMDANLYQRALNELVGGALDQLFQLLLIERARTWMAIESGRDEVVAITTGEVRYHRADARAIVTYRRKNGATNQVTLRIDRKSVV